MSVNGGVSLFGFHTDCSVMNGSMPMFVDGLLCSLNSRNTVAPPSGTPFEALGPRGARSLRVNFSNAFLRGQLGVGLACCGAGAGGRFFSITTPCRSNLEGHCMGTNGMRGGNFRFGVK